jgi:hypothetical protein
MAELKSDPDANRPDLFDADRGMDLTNMRDRLLHGVIT